MLAVSSSDVKRKGIAEQQDEISIPFIGQTRTHKLDYGQEISRIYDEEENRSESPLC